MATQDYTKTTTYRPATGTRTAELDPTTNTLTVFDGGTVLTLIAVPDDITPAQVWNLIATAQAPTEEFQGHTVETVDVADLKKGDQVVATTRTGRQYFAKVTTDAFRTYTSVGTTVTRWGHYVVELNSKYVKAEPGTTYRRATDPQAIRRDERAEHRALMAEFNTLGRRKAPQRG